MSAKLLGIVLSCLGLLAILAGSIVAGAEGSPGESDATATTQGTNGTIGIGWSMGALGVVAAFVGIRLAANANGAFS